MQGDGSGHEPASLPDREVWRRGRLIDAVEDEAERLLDLAGFADGRLDADEHERVAEWLARDPAAAGDVAAARALSAAPEAEPIPEPMLARASALVGNTSRGAPVIPFPARRTGSRPVLVARWAALAAATVMAGWLGFALGMDTSLSLAQRGQAEDSFFNEVLDPSTGLLRDLGEGVQS